MTIRPLTHQHRVHAQMLPQLATRHGLPRPVPQQPTLPGHEHARVRRRLQYEAPCCLVHVLECKYEALGRLEERATLLLREGVAFIARSGSRGDVSCLADFGYQVLDFLGAGYLLRCCCWCWVLAGGRVLLEG